MEEKNLLLILQVGRYCSRLCVPIQHIQSDNYLHSQYIWGSGMCMYCLAWKAYWKIIKWRSVERAFKMFSIDGSLIWGPFTFHILIISNHILCIFNILFTTETLTESADVYKNSPGSINIRLIHAAGSSAEFHFSAQLQTTAGRQFWKVA